MPLGKDVSKNMHELAHSGKDRSHEQMVAIAMSAAGKSNKKKKSKVREHMMNEKMMSS